MGRKDEGPHGDGEGTGGSGPLGEGGRDRSLVGPSTKWTPMRRRGVGRIREIRTCDSPEVGRVSKKTTED